MICRHAEVHGISSSCSLSASNQRLKKMFARLPYCYITLTQAPYIAKVHYHLSLRTLKEVSLVSIVSHKFTHLPCYYYWLQEIKKYGTGLASNGVMFVQSMQYVFVNVCKSYLKHFLMWCILNRLQEKIIRASVHFIACTVDVFSTLNLCIQWMHVCQDSKVCKTAKSGKHECLLQTVVCLPTLVF
jgi:hypothetical protein